MLKTPPFEVEVNTSPLPAGAGFVLALPLVLAFYGVVAVICF